MERFFDGLVNVLVAVFFTNGARPSGGRPAPELGERPATD